MATFSVDIITKIQLKYNRAYLMQNTVFTY